MKDLIIVLPVRINSSRIKEKALQKFGDTSLIEWKLNQLSEVVSSGALSAEQILVTTDSNDIIAFAKARGFRTHLRDEFYSNGHQASFSDLVAHIAEVVKSTTTYKHIAWTYCVTPFHGASLYEKCFKEYFEALNEGYDSLVAVNKMLEYFWLESGPLYSADKHHPYSQDLDPLYRVTNSLYIASVEVMLSCRYFLGYNVYKSIVPKIAGIDIDTYEDLEIARHMIPLYNFITHT